MERAYGIGMEDGAQTGTDKEIEQRKRCDKNKVCVGSMLA